MSALAQARAEYAADGVIASDTYIALTTAGYTVDEISEHMINHMKELENE